MLSVRQDSDQLVPASLKCDDDNTEIDRMAMQIRMENEKKMSLVETGTPTHNNTDNKQPSVMPKPIVAVVYEDQCSAQGQFGWTEFANNFFPYLTRGGEKYVALHMIEYKLFHGYKLLFGDDVSRCFDVKQFSMTKAEAKLLNEINLKHCDNSFGEIVFTCNNTMIKLKDAIEMNEFFYFCYTQLIIKNKKANRHGGFIRIASENWVPYVWFNSKQYVPLFFFDGECKYLEERSLDLREWELAYMRLLCKTQRIRKAFVGQDTIRVVDLEILSKCFAPDTLFEDCWPTKIHIYSLLNSKFTNKNNQGNTPKINEIVKNFPEIKKTIKLLEVQIPSIKQDLRESSSKTLITQDLLEPFEFFHYNQQESSF